MLEGKNVGLHKLKIKVQKVKLPVALAYTTLARGSLVWRSSTALPILVAVAFLALWHSSNTI